MLIRYRLIDEGYTWDEAEDLLAAWAEDAVDAERDRLAEEHFSRQDQEGVRHG